jgi:hypothetical protein
MAKFSDRSVQTYTNFLIRDMWGYTIPPNGTLIPRASTKLLEVSQFLKEIIFNERLAS